MLRADALASVANRPATLYKVGLLAGRTDVRGVYGVTGCPKYNSPAPQVHLTTLTPAEAGTNCRPIKVGG
jgi:hypothetical protein